MPAVRSVSGTSNPYITGLLSGVAWNVSSLTYSFPSSASFYGTDHDPGELTNFEVLNPVQQAAVVAAFAMVSSFTNLTFSPVTESLTTHGDLRFGVSDIALPTAWAMYPATYGAAGDSFYSNITYDNPVRGNYAFYTFVHEIGHALGLEHPHEAGVLGTMPVDRDAQQYSMMSYRSYIGGSVTAGLSNETWGFGQTFMMYDIAALQHMYGANYSYNSTATTYQWNPTTGAMAINGVWGAAPGGNRVFMTLWDGGGIDTYNLSNYSTGVTIDLRPGEWTKTSAIQLANLGNGNYAIGNIANALLYNNDTRSLIENAIGGSGNDVLIGNVVANTLDGGAGSDTVYLAGIRTDYAFSGSLLNFTANSLGVTDTLLNVEFVKFLGSNETVAVSSLLSGTVTDDYRDSISDTTASLGAITIGATRQGNIETSGDTDVFSVSLTAGQTYTFTLRGVAGGGGTLADPLLELRSSANALLASSDNANGTNDSAITFTATASGTYYLVADGVGTGLGTYTLSASGSTPPPTGDDFRDSIADTTAPFGSITVGSTSQGNIETSGDTDVFAITLAAGQAYSFSLRGSGSGGGTLGDPILELRNSSGTLLASNDDSNGTYDSLISFTATAGGTYYLVADGYSTGTGTYTLAATATTPPPASDDFRDSISDTTAPLGTITVGASRQGNIETSGDTDVFSISLTAGQTYTFSLRGSAGGGGTLGNPLLELRNNSGALVTSNDNANGTNDSQISFTASASGTYYLVADGVSTGTGTYTLSAAGSTVAADDFRDSISDRTAPLGSLTVGGSRTGNIETNGDTDVFKITLTAGQTYTFTVRGSGSSGGTLADPMLELRSSRGTLLASNDDWNGTNDSRITFTATASATYYLVADGYGTGTGTYTISAIRGTAATAAQAIEAIAGGPGRDAHSWVDAHALDFAPALAVPGVHHGAIDYFM